jgi:hypothetical protein
MTTVETTAGSLGTVENNGMANLGSSGSSGSTGSAASAAVGGITSGISRELEALQTTAQQMASSNDSADIFPRVIETVISVLRVLAGVISALVPETKTMRSGSAAESSSRSSAAPSNAATSSPSTSAGGIAATQVGPASTSQTANANSMFQVTRNDVGQIAIRTLDGYMIRAEGKEEAWTITGPDGKTTRIWGDPHVKESDGDKWDFLTRSTFAFGNNKVTAEVVPAGNGTTYTSRITIYSGDERVTIDGIDKNKPSIVAVSRDGKQHDDGLADGITYRRRATMNGESWTSNQTGRVM